MSEGSLAVDKASTSGTLRGWSGYLPFMHRSRVSEESLAIDKTSTTGTSLPEGGLGTSQWPVVASVPHRSTVLVQGQDDSIFSDL